MSPQPNEPDPTGRRKRADAAETTPPALAGLVSALLIGGVALSVALIVFGLILAARGGLLATAGVVPRTGPAAPVGEVVRRAIALDPLAVIELGVLVLIATPVARVAASVALFLAEPDYLYAVFTAVVLALLLASLFLIG